MTDGGQLPGSALKQMGHMPSLLPLLLPMSGNVIEEVMSHFGQCDVNALVMWINTQETCVRDTTRLCVREKYFHLI